MRWDLGFQGMLVLAGMSLAFGLIAQVLLWNRTTHWLWLVGSVTYFVAGLLISKAWLGRATAREMQPNIDGLSFDESLLAIFPAALTVLGTCTSPDARTGTDRSRHEPSASASARVPGGT